MNKRIGLRQRLAAATSVLDLTLWLKEGDDFEYASDATRRSWRNTAGRRLAELGRTTK